MKCPVLGWAGLVITVIMLQVAAITSGPHLGHPTPPLPLSSISTPCAPYTALLATIIVSASFLYEILSHFDYFDVRKGAIYVFSLKTLENTNIFWYAKTFLPPCL